MNQTFPLITILGPTAVGKTTFAAHLAVALDAEIISADSRQVFKGMDIGTGKDLSDYKLENRVITSHLIDIAEPGTEYNVFQFKRDFDAAYSLISAKQKTPILCGGTGLYIESVLLGYDMLEVPVNNMLRQELDQLSNEKLIDELATLRPLHNTTDSFDRDRMIRAIEIEKYKLACPLQNAENDFRKTPVLGIRFDRKTIRERISSRLYQRMNEGMLDEVRGLINNGLTIERLKFYGLEYKYVAMHLAGELSHNQMISLLNTAIHQFAKRQMTWFRRMEKKGIQICWLEGEDGLQYNLQKALDYIKSSTS